MTEGDDLVVLTGASMTQHAARSPERWSAFTLDQQVRMIANEMSRASKLMTPSDDERRRNAYARVLRLVDLTVTVQRGRGLRKELLRWCDLVARLYLEPAGAAVGHRAALRCLLAFTRTAARQRAHSPH